MRFRGIKSLVWNPGPRLNLILGGGDVGKTTILDAIALLLGPTNPSSLSDFDYYGRDFALGFVIEAVMSLPEDGGVQYQTKPSWPWEWNGIDGVPPSVDSEMPGNETVYRLRMSGTKDLEAVYEIVQPDGSTDNLSYGLRRSIGLVRLGGDDRNDRDLRLVHGSALDRLLSDPGLRSRMTNELAKVAVSTQLSKQARTTLDTLDLAFGEKRLPTGLDLALTGGPGPSIASMVALTAKRQAVDLPLTSWGSGTRRLAALSIAEQTQGAAPVTVVDEIERGLEPYRQQAVVEALMSRPCQSFATTHSPAVIRTARGASLWYVDQIPRVGALKGEAVQRLLNAKPGALLARLTIVVEGATELGFAVGLLQRAFGGLIEPHGIVITNAQGHDQTLQILEELAGVGLAFGGFADEENGRFPTRWAKVSASLGPLLFRWSAGCTEQNLIAAVSEDQLASLIEDPAGEKTGSRLRSLADRLGCADKSLEAIVFAAKAASTTLRALVVEAAIGAVPAHCPEGAKKEFRRHSERWFKSYEGGRELEAKMFALGLWPRFTDRLLPFCNAVRTTVGVEPIADLTP